MGLEDITLRETVDLEERITEIREEHLPEIEARKREFREADQPEMVDQLDDAAERLEGQATAMERVVDAAGGSEFVLEELLWGNQNLLQDDVIEASVDGQQAGEGVAPKQGFHQQRALEESLVDAPEGMETRPAGAESTREEYYRVDLLPGTVGEYLYRAVEDLNDKGHLDDLGNLSLPSPAETAETGTTTPGESTESA